MKIFFLFFIMAIEVYATQTRLLALGMKELDNDGSFYIKDDRNIFINPAHVMDFASFALFDVGGEGLKIGVNNTTLSTNEKPKALGGFLMRTSKVAFGAYLGNESNTASTLRILGSSAAAAANGVPLSANWAAKLLPTADDQIDLFFAWGEDLHWGANLYYYNPGEQSSQGTTANSGFGLRLGVKDPDRKKDLNLSISLSNKVTNNYAATVGAIPTISGTQEFDGNMGIFLGGSYQFEPLRLIAWLKTFSWDQTDTGIYPAFWPSSLGGQNGTVKGSLSIYNLGIGNELHFNSTLKFFWNVYLRQTEVEVKYNNIASAQSMVVPVVLAFEANATEWLQIRASIYQNLIGISKNKNYSSLNVVARGIAVDLFGPDSNGNTSSLPSTTDVQFGSSLIFGKLKIDGLVGSNEVSLTDFSKFYVRAALSYKF